MPASRYPLDRKDDHDPHPQPPFSPPGRSAGRRRRAAPPDPFIRGLARGAGSVGRAGGAGAWRRAGASGPGPRGQLPHPGGAAGRGAAAFRRRRRRDRAVRCRLAGRARHRRPERFLLRVRGLRPPAGRLRPGRARAQRRRLRAGAAGRRDEPGSRARRGRGQPPRARLAKQHRPQAPGRVAGAQLERLRQARRAGRQFQSPDQQHQYPWPGPGPRADSRGRHPPALAGRWRARREGRIGVGGLQQPVAPGHRARRRRQRQRRRLGRDLRHRRPAHAQSVRPAGGWQALRRAGQGRLRHHRQQLGRQRGAGRPDPREHLLAGAGGPAQRARGRQPRRRGRLRPAPQPAHARGLQPAQLPARCSSAWTAAIASA